MHEADIIAYLNGHGSPEDRAAVETWKQASPENSLAFARIRKIWEETGTPDIPPIPNVDTSWEKLRLRTVHRPKLYALPKRWRNIAAAILLVAVGYTSYLIAQRPGYEVYATDGNNVGEIELADGTRVHLDRNSSLRYPKTFRGRERKVALSGQGYFEVARAEGQTFLIDAGETMVQVLGTKFYLMAHPDSNVAEVQVTEGKVAFFHEDAVEKKLELTAGEGGKFNHRENRLVKLNTASMNLNRRAWVTQVLTFENAKLQEVIAEIENTLGIEVRLEDPTLGERRLTARIPVDREKPEQTLMIIETLFKLSVEQPEPGIFLLREQ